MIRGLVIATLVVSVFLSYLYYQKRAQIESQTQLSLRYESGDAVKLLITNVIFENLSRAIPRTISFIVGLDPKVSKLAPLRWAFILLLGWLHFCFLSPYQKHFSKFGWSRSDLFFLPFTVILVLSLLSAFLNNYETLSHTIGLVIIGLGSITILVALLAIPLTISSWLLGAIRFLSGQTGNLKITEKPELPSPIVKRKLIDGVWYDE